jgi:hypothetical protein
MHSSPIGKKKNYSKMGINEDNNQKNSNYILFLVMFVGFKFG